MPTYDYKRIRITDLLLNNENPRFNPVMHQTEAISAMIDDQNEKLVELARHIVENGLNPMEIILVQPLGKQWLVREGNRRVTVLKLLNEPELVPTSYKKLKPAFVKLSKSISSDILDNILCVIATDNQAINEWILLKHTGENKGIGTVSWNSMQTSRFASQVTGKVDPKSALLEQLHQMEELPSYLKEDFSKIKKTNFDRLVGDPAVRQLLGIETIDGRFNLPNGINEYMIEVLTDLTNDINVGKIYKKSDREKYLDEIRERKKQRSGIPGSIQQQHKHTEEFGSIPLPGDPVDVDKTKVKEISPNSSDKEEKQKKSYPIHRKTLVPSIHRLPIGNPRVARIFGELKTLDCDKYPNAVATLFRVFIELSCDCYISTCALSGVNVDSKLRLKVEAVANDIEEKKLMTKNELRSARQMASGDTQNQSVKTLHAYVHNKDVTPVTKDLCVAWDDVWPFIKTMWR